MVWVPKLRESENPIPIQMLVITASHRGSTNANSTTLIMHGGARHPAMAYDPRQFIHVPRDPTVYLQVGMCICSHYEFVVYDDMYADTTYYTGTYTRMNNLVI